MACVICAKATVPQRRAILQSKCNSQLIPALSYLIEKVLQTEQSPTVVDLHNLLSDDETGTLTYLCCKCCTKLSHFSDVENKLIESLKEGNITNRIAGLVAHTSQAQSAQSQPGSQPAKRSLEEQHTPTSKKQKRTALLSVSLGIVSNSFLTLNFLLGCCWIQVPTKNPFSYS